MAETPTGEELNPTPLRKSTINKADANLLQNVNIGGAPPEKIPVLIRDALKAKMVRVIDCFRQLDDDKDGIIDGPEFAKGLKEMGLTAPDAAIGAIFASFDPDGSGLISFEELHSLVIRSAKSSPKLPPLPLTAKNPIALRVGEVSKKNSNIMQGLDLTSADPETIPGLIREALNAKLLRVIDVFRQLDDDGSGMIDGEEFAKGMKEMGLADAPDEALGAVFASFDPDGDELLEFDEMHDLLVRSFQTYPELPPLELTAKNPIALRKAPLNKRDANLFQGAIDLATASPEEIPKLIREALHAKLTRVIDLFRQLDDDNSGLIDGHEFKKGLKEMGLAGMPPESLGALFASFDPDGDKYIEYDELHELIVRSAMKHPDLPPLALEAKNPIAIRKKKIKKEDANLLQDLDLDEDHMEQIPGQIKAALQRNSVRMLDFFRQMDDDASGSISRKEFRKALCEIGLKAPKVAIDWLFSEFDEDGYGSIEYDELKDQLRHSAAFVSDEQAEALGEREEERLRPSTEGGELYANVRDGSGDDGRPRTTPRGSTKKMFDEAPAPAPEAPPRPPPPPTPHYVEPLVFDTVDLGTTAGGLQMLGSLFLNFDACGNNRVTSKLALVMHPLPTVKAKSKKSDIVLGSLPLLRMLADTGWSILYVEPHGLGSPLKGAASESSKKLAASLELISTHRKLRYCKVAILTQGPAASAAIACMSSMPEAFDYRVRVLSACQPAPVKGMGSPVFGDLTLAQHAKSVAIPTFVSYATEEPRAMQVAKDVAANIEAGGVPTAVMPVSGQTLYGQAARFDGLGYFATAPEELLEFLEVQIA